MPVQPFKYAFLKGWEAAAVRVGERPILASYTSCALLVLTRRQNRLVFSGSNHYFSLTLKVLLAIPLILLRQDVFIHSKLTRPTRRLRMARTYFKTRSKNTTRRQDLQDAFAWHAPISRLVRKTWQDAFAYNKTWRPTRRIPTARSHFKTPSKTRQDAKTHNKTTRLTRRIWTARSHLRRVRKTRQDAFAHNKTPRPTRRIRTQRSHFKTRS